MKKFIVTFISLIALVAVTVPLSANKEFDFHLCIWGMLSKYEINIYDGYQSNTKTKALIGSTIAEQLISAFVFATKIVQSPFFLIPKFLDCNTERLQLYFV